MKLNYFRLLLLTTIKKKTTWIFIPIFLVLYAVVFYILPHIRYVPLVTFWDNPIVSVSMMFVFLTCIYSAVLAVGIFKEFNDNGSELIIISKPISRAKIISIKFITFFVVILAVDFIVSQGAWFSAHTIEFSPLKALSLFASLFIGNFIFMAFFGLISILASIFWNKIWSILSVVILAFVFSCYSNIVTFAIDTPSQIFTKDGSTVSSERYVCEDGSENSMGAIVPDISKLMSNNASTLDFSLANQAKQWDDYNNNSGFEFSQFIDMFNSYKRLNSLFAVEDELERSASLNFAFDEHNFRYLFSDHHVWEEPEIPPPIFFVDMPNFSTDNLSSTEIIYQNTGAFINDIMSTLNIFTQQSMTFFGTQTITSDAPISIQQFLGTSSLANIPVTEIYNGSGNGTRTYVSYNFDEASEMPQAQKDLFDAINSAIIGSEANIYIGNLWNEMDTLNGDGEIAPTQYKYIFHPEILPGFNGLPTTELIDSMRENSLLNGLLPADDALPEFFSTENGGNTLLNIIKFLICKENETQHWYEVQSNEAVNEIASILVKWKFYTMKTLCHQVSHDQGLDASQHTKFSFPSAKDIESPNNIFDNDNGSIKIDASPVMPFRLNSSGQYIVEELVDDIVTLLTNAGFTNAANMTDFIRSILDVASLYFFKHPTIEKIDIPEITSNPVFYELINGDEGILALLKTYFNWTEPDNHNTYWTDPTVTKERALLNFVTAQQNYSYNNATPDNFTLSILHAPNLLTSKISSFPLIYNAMSATFTVEPIFSSAVIGIFWSCLLILLATASVILYYRIDFK